MVKATWLVIYRDLDPGLRNTKFCSFYCASVPRDKDVLLRCGIWSISDFRLRTVTESKDGGLSMEPGMETEEWEAEPSMN